MIPIHFLYDGIIDEHILTCASWPSITINKFGEELVVHISFLFDIE